MIGFGYVVRLIEKHPAASLAIFVVAVVVIVYCV
jgi:hypothetical protein